MMRFVLSSQLLLALLSCDDSAKPDDSASPADADGDGHIADADAVLSWSSNVGYSYHGIGRPIHFGDLDDDGLDDLLIGLPGSYSNGYRSGSVLHLPGGL